MGTKRMLVNVTEDETRIALIDGKDLIDLHVEQSARGRTAGNIYRGTIVKVNPAFQAAFVEYGEKKNGFLSLSDLNPSFFEGHHDGPQGRPRIQSLLRRGQNVMVQVLKEGVGAKGAALSTNVGLPGRYMVLSPFSDRTGVSRKIDESADRTRLKEFLAGLSAGGMGVIVRTAGIDRSLAELKRDFTDLRREWKTIQDKFKKSRSAGLLYSEPGSVVRVLRDYFSDEVDEVWVDAPEVYQVALDYFKRAMPKFQKRLKLYVGDRPLFAVYGIEERIEALDDAKVPLRSGGSIVIDSTEAMVAIDVNSGRSNQESDIEETALRTNLEAGDEIARQLRLRNLGGLIVVDFIDMVRKTNQRKVVQAMTNALKHDKARTTLGSISQFGLLELSRQRIDMELSRGLRIPCGHCGGTGYVPTVHASANQVLRKIRELAASGGGPQITGTLPLEHANFLLNNRRESLTELEMEFGIRVHLFGDPDMPEGATVKLQGEGAGRDSGESIPDEPESFQPAGPAAESTADDERGTGDGSRRRRRRRRGRRGPEDAPRHEDTPRDELLVAGGDGFEPDPDEAAWADAAGAAAPEDEPDVLELTGEDLEEDELIVEEDREAAAEAATNTAEADEDPPRAPEKAPAPRPARPAAPSNPLPTTFSLGRSRGRRSPNIGANTPAGEAIFHSAHREDGNGREVALPPTPKRDNPLDAMAANAEPNAVVYQSAHRGDGNGTPPTDGGERPAGRRRGRGRRPGRSRGAAPSVAAAQAVEQEGSGNRRESPGDSPAVDEISGNRAGAGGDVQPGAEVSGNRREPGDRGGGRGSRGRGRGGRSGSSRGGGRSDGAPSPGNQRTPASASGNTGGERSGGGRGRGRRRRPSTAASN